MRTLHEREPGGLTRDRPCGVGIPGCKRLSRLNGWPMLSPANASPDTSRCPTHDKGSVWLSGRGADLLDTSPTDPGVQLSCTGLSSKVKRDRLDATDPQARCLSSSVPRQLRILDFLSRPGIDKRRAKRGLPGSDAILPFVMWP